MKTRKVGQYYLDQNKHLILIYNETLDNKNVRTIDLTNNESWGTFVQPIKVRDQFNISEAEWLSIDPLNGLKGPIEDYEVIIAMFRSILTIPF